jgi:hypothetical protein
MPIKRRPLGLVLMTLALLLSGCATMPQSQSVETVEETSRAIPEPQIATPENKVLAAREAPAISPEEVSAIGGIKSLNQDNLFIIK